MPSAVARATWMSDLLIGVQIRAHQRSITLDIALSEWRRIGTLPGLRTKISVLTDRPTWQVSKVIEKYRPHLFNVLESPCELVSPTGERFMQAANHQLAGWAETPLDWIAYCDDDFWLEPIHATEELPVALRNDDVDMYYANCLFFWDSSNTFNPSRRHCSPLFFRPLHGDTFPPDRERIIHATANRHDDAILTGRTAVLSTPLLEYGSLTSSERIRLSNVFQEAGKSDAFTAPLTAPSPALLSFPEDAVRLGLTSDIRWRDLYLERTQSNAV